jgi:hypothetical protein
MRLIDRLYEYMQYHRITPYAFEHACGISNGYLAKQKNGKGSVGSDMLERISMVYPDLNLLWLITGSGEMLVHTANGRPAGNSLLILAQLQQQIRQLEKTVRDKDSIIRLLQERHARQYLQ